MSSASVRTIAPLALITCTSMLAMDLYLPAVPNLQAAFGVEVTWAQATIAVFLAGLAASQLLWAEALNRLGPRQCVRVGLWLLILAAIGCALAPTIEVLLFTRLLQGVAAGAATIVSPTVVRAMLSDTDAVRGLAIIGMVESLVPAIGPVLGAALLEYTDWRGTFWVLCGLTLLSFPLGLKVTPRELPGMDRTVTATYASILTNRRFMRLTLSHALSLGALLTFVASGPQLVVNMLRLETSAFATLQILGVACFIVFASQSGRISHSMGASRAIQLGAWIQVILCLVIWLISTVTVVPFTVVAVFWTAFCGSLAVKGPPIMSEALSLPPVQMGRASALMVLFILIVGAGGTQLVAPFMDDASPAPLLLGMFVACVLSLWLVIPYPHSEPRTES